MADSIYRYALDPTGTNRDNAISNELHTLSVADFRVIAPEYGPFFTESVAVYDKNTNIVLIKNKDYFCAELLQEPTLKYGKEIAQIIVITNTAISSNVGISYQTLGGLFQNSAKAVANLYETVMKDNRPVDYKNVMNKPMEFPPTLHLHLLRDTIGFEPLVVAMERIRNAIALSDVPAWEALVDWVKQYVASRVNISENADFLALAQRVAILEFKSIIVSEAEISNMNGSSKLVSFERLVHAAKALNFNAITINPNQGNTNGGDTLNFTIQTSNLAENTILYWTIKHIDTDNADFAGTSGIINISGNRGTFNLTINASQKIEPAEGFYVDIRRNGVDGPVLATSGRFGIFGHNVNEENMADLFLSCCLYKPTTPITIKRMYINGGFSGH